MNEKLNQDLREIALKRNELNRLSYNSPEYDTVEEELHDLEDEFTIEHGDYLEDILTSIYRKIPSENEVMIPVAYIAKKYNIIPAEKAGRNQFEPPMNEGIVVDAAKPGAETFRLVICPDPLRFLLQKGKKERTEVWVDE